MATPTSNTVPIRDIAIPSDILVASLVAGAKWGGALGTGVTLTYSFPTAASVFTSSYGSDEDDVNEPDSVQGLNAADRDHVTQALTSWSNIANLTFNLVADAATVVGEIRVAVSGELTFTDAAAWAYYPSSGPWGGDIWIDPSLPVDGFNPPSFNFNVLVHEIGHALGLKHPHEDPPLLPGALDSVVYTVMSYGPDQPLDRYPTTPMVLDIEAIQYLYGKNMAYHAGNNVYTYDDDGEYFETIWDGGGADKILYTGTTGATIDLRPGMGSTAGQPVLEWVGFWDIYETKTVWIAKGVTIEHATGGYGNDIIIGNNAANTLMGNIGNDSLSGMNGNDRLLGGSGNDLLTGGVGQDYLDGGPGSDRYRATAGETRPDTYKDTGSGAADVDTILTAGVPTLFLPATFSEGVSGIDAITNSTGTTILTGAGETRVNWDFRTITLRGIRQLGGTDLADRIVGSVQNDVMAGKGGNDSLFGYAGHDWINGGAGNDFVSGGAGNDNLQGSTGNDLVQGGPGNDIVHLDTADVRGVQGESGRDTLKLGGGGLVLDLSAILDTQFTGFEIFDITGTGNNQLRLDIDDVLALPDGMDAFFADGTTQLLVLGNAGDSVSLLDLGWVEGTDLMVNGIECTPYIFNTAQLLIDTDLNVIVG